MTKKLLVILTLVVLVSLCMALPAMADDLSWTLVEGESTIIEGEHFFNNTKVDPESIPQKDEWSSHDGANNGHIYLNKYEELGTYTYYLIVNAPYTGYYDLEYIANSSQYSYSKIKFSASGYDVSSNLLANDETGTTNSGGNPYETLFDDAALDMRRYTKEDFLLNEGTNVISIVIYNGTTRNAWAMDYIRLTPTGVRVDNIPFEVSAFDDNSVDATCFSLYFSKPVTDTTGIAVAAQSGDATLTIDGSNPNKVNITGIAGRATITVPATFKGGRNEVIAEACTKEAFAYPFSNISGKNYPAVKYSDPSIRKVGGYYGSVKGMKNVTWRYILAVYDGDKLVATKASNTWGATGGSVNVILEEGVKFTHAKIFAWWNIGNEWIPLGSTRSVTAEDLGFTFE